MGSEMCIRDSPFYLQNEKDVLDLLPGVLQSGDILLTQGAGSVGALSKLIARNLFIVE